MGADRLRLFDIFIALVFLVLLFMPSRSQVVIALLSIKWNSQSDLANKTVTFA